MRKRTTTVCYCSPQVYDAPSIRIDRTNYTNAVELAFWNGVGITIHHATSRAALEEMRTVITECLEDWPL